MLYNAQYMCTLEEFYSYIAMAKQVLYIRGSVMCCTNNCTPLLAVYERCEQI